MDITVVLRAFCDAVERRNGASFAALFAEDGVYHDVFYGAFAGRENIATMIDDRLLTWRPETTVSERSHG